jgi:hypothetical protein
MKADTAITIGQEGKDEVCGQDQFVDERIRAGRPAST